MANSTTSSTKQYRTSRADWPFSLSSYEPATTYGEDVILKLSDFESKHLSKETAIKRLSYNLKDQVNEEVLNEVDIIDDKMMRSNSLEIYFINRFIIKPDAEDTPKDIRRLRISKMALRSLMTNYEISPSFVAAIADNDLASSPICYRVLSIRDRPCIDVWYVLPIRTEIKCTESAKSHTLSNAGSNQMDPSRYLHLEDVGMDIRPSKIVMFVRHDQENHDTSVIVFDFQDGRWWHLADEPYQRAKEKLTFDQGSVEPGSHFNMHLIVLSSVVKWWKTALLSINKQLISYEKQLQDQIIGSKAMESTSSKNKALHTAAAHLHRYKSEIALLSLIVSSLSENWSCSCTKSTRGGHAAQSIFVIALRAIADDVTSLQVSIEELQSKIKTILGLLFNIIQAKNDALMLANGRSMRKIMKATRTETELSRRMAKQSQTMAAGMKKDSISMKAIAILTMGFLPGTAYAAILSMPFFVQSAWLDQIDKVWVWVALTIPTTLVTFAIFVYVDRRGARSIFQTINDGSMEHIELTDADSNVEV